MRKELQEKLFKEYPGIFAQSKLNKYQSCMARGIECDDGWYELINTLCSSIQFRVDNPQYVDITPWYKKSFNWVSIKINNSLYYISYKIAREDPKKFHVYQQWEKLPILTRFLRKVAGLIPTCVPTIEKPKKNQTEFGQVKEKFGQLTIYPDYSNDELNGMISMAAAMSRKLCEVCGHPANICVRGYWVKTLCHNCIEKNDTYKGYEKAKSR